MFDLVPLFFIWDSGKLFSNRLGFPFFFRLQVAGSGKKHVAASV